MFDFATLRMINAKESKSLRLFSLIDAFLYRYKLYQLIGFIFLANSTLYFLNRFKVQPKTSIEYESFYDSFHRANLTIARETAYLMNQQSIFQLADNLTNQSAQGISKVRKVLLTPAKPESLSTAPSILKQITTFASHMNLKANVIANVYYTDKDGVLFIDPKNGIGAIKYKGRIYDVNGKRLDVMHKLLKPLQIVTAKSDAARITSGYGYRIHPVLKRRLFHAGIDIRAPIGSKIHAALNGHICKIGYNSGYGNFIIIQHANKVQTLYGHLHAIHPNISIGKKILQGDVIGFVGKTGRATGPHVHFETRVEGKHANPSTIGPLYEYANQLELRMIRAKIKELRQTLQ